MAMQKAFSVPELLESIIYHLPERNILTIAQRVSRGWSSLIDSSPTIQKKIWQQTYGNAISPSEISINSPGALLGSPIYSRSVLVNDLIVGGDSLRRPERGSQLPKFDSALLSLSQKKHNIRFVSSLLATKDLKTRERDKDSANYAHPSWYTMYISDLPVTTVLVGLKGVTAVQATLYERAGITMGMVCDVLTSMSEACRSTGLDESCKPLRTIALLGWFETKSAG